MKGDRKVFVVWLHRGSPGTINDSLDLHLLNLMCSGDIRFICRRPPPFSSQIRFQIKGSLCPISNGFPMSFVPLDFIKVS